MTIVLKAMADATKTALDRFHKTPTSAAMVEWALLVHPLFAVLAAEAEKQVAITDELVAALQAAVLAGIIDIDGEPEKARAALAKAGAA